MIVSANNQSNNHQTPHTTYSINGILGIDADHRKAHRKGHHISVDHHQQLSPPGHTNGVVDLDASDLKRRPSTTTGLNSGISQYNGLTNNENLYLSWSQGTGPYGDTPESVHPPHHYESTSLYTPPTLGTSRLFIHSLQLQPKSQITTLMNLVIQISSTRNR